MLLEYYEPITDYGSQFNEPRQVSRIISVNIGSNYNLRHYAV